MAEFFDMGGYARYVWSAWGISAVVLLGTVIAVRASLRTTREQLRSRLQSRAGAEARS
ncbi:MAG: heme exporter protein CcmD [Gammaproteobacteria bacterium]|nr:heme exporter protein CcmD [Gammaproteobacteria bacterium]